MPETLNLLIVPVNDAEVSFGEVEEQVCKSEFFGNLKLNISHSSESLHVPTDMERAAPWHTCPVTEEFGGVKGRRCHRLNYCLMYVIDELEGLYEEYPDIDCYLLIFPDDPLRSGGFFSFQKRCVCVKNDSEEILNEISAFADVFRERC